MFNLDYIKKNVSPELRQESEDLMRKILAVRSAITVTETPSTPKQYAFPSVDLLNATETRPEGALVESSVLEQRLSEFGIKGQVVNICRGPIVSRYEIKLATGVKLSQVRSIVDDLAVALSVERIRILAPIPGTSLVGVEVVNQKPATVNFKPSKASEKLPLFLGVDTAGNYQTFDLTSMPHVLVAGQTGSGKSGVLNAVILSILYSKTPDECKLVLVDPKRVEMASYRKLPHLLRPVITEPREAIEAFHDLVSEMETRYTILEQAGCRNIESYNATGRWMPYIVVIVDEMADLMMTSGKELEGLIVRLAQLARATGIHLVLATQKPIVKVVTGLIKSNIPTRIALQTVSKSDSRIIIDCNGAEKLAGRGDLLMVGPGIEEPERYHGAWVSDHEIKSITDWITQP